jgi:UDP-glucose 4-epimerase
MAQKLILVTGGAGFIGSNLVKRLVRAGHRVISLDNYFAGSKENHVAGAEYWEGHTKDIERHIPETPDIIFHLGEYARVEQSVLEPDVVEDLNTVGTAAVLEFWKRRKCKLVYAGSSTKFGDGGKTRTTSPYARTKAANSELVKEIGEREKLPYAITYFYNVYGPGERAGVYGTVVEAFRQMHARGAPLTVVAPGTQLRNFTHVDDIVDGLILIAEGGQGDEFGLGNERAYSVLDIARLFGGEILMMPERAGNRMQSGLDTSKAAALGWKTKRSLEEYVVSYVKEHPARKALEKRVLVFSTTFYPVEGPAERSLVELMKKMPDVQFDIVTSLFSKAARSAPSPAQNAHIFRVGFGNSFDKYLLPLLGLKEARRLHRAHSYPFAWSLMASYAALLGVFFKRRSHLPLLITLADQRLETLSSLSRFTLRHIITGADQVYGMHAAQEKRLQDIAKRPVARNSMGDGDAFANAIRFAYASIFEKVAP